MNQRFEDTYAKAVDAIAGMAKDYRLLDERNRLLKARVSLVEDGADLLRDKLSAAQEKSEELQNAIDVLCMDLVKSRKKAEHPEYREAKFSLSVPADLCVDGHDFVGLGDGTARCAKCPAQVDVSETSAARRPTASDFPPPDVRTSEHEESDIDLAVGTAARIAAHRSFTEQFAAPADRLIPRPYDSYFDVLMWRWIFNTVCLAATEEEARRLDPT